MPYTVRNFRTGKQVKEAIAAGETVEVYQPGPFGPEVKDGWCCLEGPHYPEPHRWYIGVIVKDGVAVAVQKSPRR
jgi:hypothetical protein